MPIPIGKLDSLKHRLELQMHQGSLQLDEAELYFSLLSNGRKELAGEGLDDRKISAILLPYYQLLS